MSNYKMTIDGRQVDSVEEIRVINPATGQVMTTAPSCSMEQVNTAMAAAALAYTKWRVNLEARRVALAAIAKALFASADELAAVLTAEQGKPLADARSEVIGAGVWFKYFAALELPTEIVQDDQKARIELRRRPLGVVAAITPWNFPVILACWKLAPALLAGNTVVLKPSPYTPLTTLRLGELLGELLPPGVLNVVSGGDELGAWMTAHPTPRKISFTGSVAKGARVAAAAAPDLKRLTLELGGNDPAIILDDVEPSSIADRLFWGAFQNNGQVCSAIKRVYVPEHLHDEIVEELADRARSVRVGDGATEGTQLGPINNRPQHERVSSLVAEAIADGARAAAGGKALDRPGYFFEPTIIVGACEGSRIVDEEQFGPALPVMAYRSLDEAVERANAGQFGLSGSVWGSDTDRASEVAARLECGTTWVNTHLALQPNQPFGGAKWSGIGVENGTLGLYGFTDIQVVHRSKV